MNGGACPSARSFMFPLCVPVRAAIRPSGTHVPGTTEKEPIMDINLHDITGQESGIILVETDDGRTHERGRQLGRQ